MKTKHFAMIVGGNAINLHRSELVNAFFFTDMFVGFLHHRERCPLLSKKGTDVYVQKRALM